MQKLNVIKSRIFENAGEIKSWLAYWRFKSEKIVFTNGCFDILHKGHVDYLARAASHGNMMIVGLNTDESVKRINGNGRPIQDQESRAMPHCFLLMPLFFSMKILLTTSLRLCNLTYW